MPMVLGIVDRGLEVRVALDRRQILNRTCRNGPEWAAALVNAKADVRLVTPPGTSYSNAHQKFVIFDREVLINGGANLSGNSLTNSI